LSLGEFGLCEVQKTGIKSIGIAAFVAKHVEGHLTAVAYPGILFVGGVQQIQLRTEDSENGDLRAVAH